MKKTLLALLLIGAVACDSHRDMVTRSYELSRLSVDEATSLLTPYVGEGGYLSGKNKLISVRETPKRLEEIEKLLQKYDGIGEAQDVLLDIQVIDADGFTQQDSAIADVEQTLRQMFKYRGYKLRAEAHVQAREDSNFQHQVSGISIRGRVYGLRKNGNEQRLPIEVMLHTPQTEMASTVTATIGKPVVLGQSVADGAVILVIRTSLAGS